MGVRDIYVKGKMHARRAGRYNTNTGVYTTLRTDEHYFKKFDAWAVDSDVIEQLKKLDCPLNYDKRICVEYSGRHGKRNYWITLEEFIAFSSEYDWGWNLQLFCSLRYFDERIVHKYKRKPLEMIRFEKPEEEKKVNMSLEEFE